MPHLGVFVLGLDILSIQGRVLHLPHLGVCTRLGHFILSRPSITLATFGCVCTRLGHFVLSRPSTTLAPFGCVCTRLGHFALLFWTVINSDRITSRPHHSFDGTCFIVLPPLLCTINSNAGGLT